MVQPSRTAWKDYTLATKLDKEEEERQVATLLAVIGKEANKVFRTFTWASEGDAKKIAPVFTKFENYCVPRENTIYERFLFFTRDQRESETDDQYVTELRQIVANCDFDSLTPDQLLRDRLVIGIRNGKVRENLLKEKKLTLEKALDIASAAESTAAQMKVMTTESGLNAVKEKEKEQSDGSLFVNDSRIKDCNFCGRNQERHNCPAFGQTCAYCERKNHFVAKCPAKILANEYEQPKEGKATLFVTRKENTHKIQVNVVKGRGYEPGDHVRNEPDKDC